VLEDILAIVLIFGGGTIVALGFSPVGRAVADRIRGKHALPETEELRAELAEQRETQAEDVMVLRRELGELAERLDFAERLLTQQREAQRLAGGAQE
jgi:Tfp pilus assembly protein PilO